MEYNTFLTRITEELQQALGSGYTLSLRPLPRNNGVMLDGLTVWGKEIRLAPTIYLTSYYQQLNQGMSMREILEDILALIHTTPVPDTITSQSLQDFEALRSRIMFRVIHTESNTQLLSGAPHIPFMDLSIVFFLFLEHNETGQMTIQIHNPLMETWKVTTGDLWKLARKNTPREYPAEIRSMTDMMKEIARDNLGEHYDEACLDALLGEESISPLYVLTNQNGMYGAGCMIYQNVLKNFADAIGKDLIVLPSSIHEVLLTPDCMESSYEDLSAMVTAINQQEVPLEDQLSNQVYLYSRSSDRLQIMTSARQLKGAGSLS